MARTMPDEESSDATARVSPDETARYIEGLTSELSVMARRAGFDLLAYLLDVAREEAAARAFEADADRTRKS